MTQHEKDLARLLTIPKDFPWATLVSVLKRLGYEERKGKGSHRTFVHIETKAVVSCPKPHGGAKHVKQVYVENIVVRLRERGQI